MINFDSHLDITATSLLGEELDLSWQCRRLLFARPHCIVELGSLFTNNRRILGFAMRTRKPGPGGPMHCLKAANGSL